MTKPLNIVFIGLTLSSSWGNGHATTFRSLLRGLNASHHSCLFLERDMPWYANARDMPHPDFCRLAYYDRPEQLAGEFAAEIRAADAVVIGSYVPDGVAVIDLVHALSPRCLCFYDIDTPVTLAKIERGDEEYIARRQFPLFDVYFSFSGGTVLTLLEERYGVRTARALYCSVDPDRYFPTGEAFEWDLGYLGTYSSDRQPVLERLLIEPARRLPHRRFVVAGPSYPDSIDWPANVVRIEHLPPEQHRSFYSRQRFTLNVTRADMVALGWSPSVRLFEAAACHAPIISDAWEGLDSLLPEGDALVIARRPEDVVTVLETLPEASRQSQAERAAKIVLASHTGEARGRELVQALSAARLPHAKRALSA
ncbi:CgeB family protein [Rhizobium paknamense]|uniref:Spore maturation protein CgeB n=1 Tax=Rhizobium paknamense TaxID=1206817 RepID=A0ABU0IHV1_9HYPH|nr:glycosyltransferase [Rhizobium paknamense]MDQ0457848.1 spore maturation protein CgeB [Rhizobium paknamense]